MKAQGGEASLISIVAKSIQASTGINPGKFSLGNGGGGGGTPARAAAGGDANGTTEKKRKKAAAPAELKEEVHAKVGDQSCDLHTHASSAPVG